MDMISIVKLDTARPTEMYKDILTYAIRSRNTLARNALVRQTVDFCRLSHLLSRMVDFQSMEIASLVSRIDLSGALTRSSPRIRTLT
jgi:hypothetical protein